MIRDLLRGAIQNAGSQAKLAAACGLSQAAISKALRRGRLSPASALKIEAVTGINRASWCPDFFVVAAHSGSEA